MNQQRSGKNGCVLVGASCVAGLLLLLLSHLWSGAPVLLLGGGSVLTSSSSNMELAGQSGASQTLFNGSVPSLSWIIGRDCQSGIQAYLQHAATNPDAALVGTGWLDPTTGGLIDGSSNNCAPGTLSMDSVIQLVHQHGGKVYLTIAMETDGSASSWTTAQQTAYEVKATQTPGYIDPILHEVQRAQYDGVIMDLEGTDAGYPNIQQIFATYNRQVWHALQAMNKLYGIALIHKTSDQDEYYGLNGFENWSLLGKSADFIVIMAVDQSYWTPGPSVSVPWLRQLLAYAEKTMPQMLPSIIWELPLYGNSWHQVNGQWVFDGIIDYQDAMKIVDGVNQGQIDQGASNLRDAYQPHLVYTDSGGVQQSLWFMNGASLHNIMHDFQQMLRQQAGFSQGSLQFAVWWRTTAEPGDFWSQVDPLY